MTDLQDEPIKIVKDLLKNDPFSQWMAIEVVEAEHGICTVKCEITGIMLNGFKVVHGGIIFSLADTALAFSAATAGRVALALDNSISYTKKAILGDTLSARSEVINLTYRTGLFDIKVTNQSSDVIAVMKGTVYRTKDTVTDSRSS